MGENLHLIFQILGSENVLLRSTKKCEKTEFPLQLLTFFHSKSSKIRAKKIVRFHNLLQHFCCIHVFPAN